MKQEFPTVRPLANNFERMPAASFRDIMSQGTVSQASYPCEEHLDAVLSFPSFIALLEILAEHVRLKPCTEINRDRVFCFFRLS